MRNQQDKQMLQRHPSGKTVNFVKVHNFWTWLILLNSELAGMMALGKPNPVTKLNWVSFIYVFFFLFKVVCTFWKLSMGFMSTFYQANVDRTRFLLSYHVSFTDENINGSRKKSNRKTMNVRTLRTQRILSTNVQPETITCVNDHPESDEFLQWAQSLLCGKSLWTHFYPMTLVLHLKITVVSPGTVFWKYILGNLLVAQVV